MDPYRLSPIEPHRKENRTCTLSVDNFWSEHSWDKIPKSLCLFGRHTTKNKVGITTHTGKVKNSYNCALSHPWDNDYSFKAVKTATNAHDHDPTAIDLEHEVSAPELLSTK